MACEDEEVHLDGDRVPAASRAVLRVENSFLGLALGTADPFDSDFLDAPKGAQLASAVSPLSSRVAPQRGQGTMEFGESSVSFMAEPD